MCHISFTHPVKLGEVMNEQYPSRRSVVHSVKGVAAATQPLAAAAAVKILELGGNAADAAIAMAAAMGVVEPMMTGIGGDAFILYYDAATKTVQGLNGSGKSAKSLTFEDVEAVAENGAVPPDSALTVNVPGAAAAWIDIVEKWGSKKLKLGDVLAPAIEIARDGFPVSTICSEMWLTGGKKLRASKYGEELLIDGKAPQDGEVFRNENLAKVYERLAASGKDGFYAGQTGKAIVDVVANAGGKLTAQDMLDHTSLFLEPITAKVTEEVTIHELPPNNHGIVALIAFNIINHLDKTGAIDLSKMEHNSPEYLHVLIEALKFAFKDADQYVGDPHLSDVSISQLLTPEFTESRAKLFSATAANKQYEHGAIDPSRSSDTSYFTVTDSAGNACSMIASVFQEFGTGIVPPDCGFALHNRGLNFNLRKGSRNSFGGGKRSYHTIIPAMLTAGDELYATFGVMGAFMQPQGHVQVAYNLTRFGLSPQQALDAPRICIAPHPALLGIPTSADIVVLAEQGISRDTVTVLEKLGHRVSLVAGDKRSVFGRGQVICKDQKSSRLVYHAGSDPRGDGAAIPQI